MKKLWKNRYGWFFLLTSLALLFFFVKNHKKSESSNLGTVIRGDLIQRVTIAGSVTPNRKTLISAPYNGYVRKLYVQIGDEVHSGDSIVSIAQSLHGSGEDIYPLRAPFSGKVVQILRTEGEYVEQAGSQNTSNALVRIDDLSRIFIDASAPEIEVNKLKIGQEVILKASAILQKTYKGKIVHISLAAKEQSGWDKSRVEYPIVIEVTDKDENLKPGMTVIVDIITKKLVDVLMLPHEYIQKTSDRYFVITKEGKSKDIEVGIQNEEVFEIKKGLQEGEKIRQTDFLSILKEP